MAERLCKYCGIVLVRGTVQAHEKACPEKPPPTPRKVKEAMRYRCPVCEERFERAQFAPHVRQQHPAKETSV